jgi:hypothetical protein
MQSALRDLAAHLDAVSTTSTLISDFKFQIEAMAHYHEKI